MENDRKKPSANGLKLRPHHALCAQFFTGHGYSEQFVAHMRRTLDTLNRGASVTLVNGCDCICAGCPNNQNGVCETDEKVRAIDRRVLDATGLSFGDTLPWRDLCALAQERIIVLGALPSVCGGCEWIGLCKNRLS